MKETKIKDVIKSFYVEALKENMDKPLVQSHEEI